MTKGPLNILVPAQRRREERSRGREEWLMGCLRTVNRLDRYSVRAAQRERQRYADRKCWSDSREIRRCVSGLSLWPTCLDAEKESTHAHTHTQIWLPSFISHLCKQTPLFDSWHGCHQLDMEKAKESEEFEILRSVESITDFSRLCGMFEKECNP